MDGFSGLAQRLTTHVSYARIFQDALSLGELVACCAPDDPERVLRELEDLAARGKVERVDGHWCLPGAAPSDLAARKRESERRRLEILRDSRTLLGVLARLPLVRMLAISGSVARRGPVGARGKAEDLDLFVITEPSGVHIVRFVARALSAGARVLAALGLTRRRASVCPNYVLECTALEVPNPSFYTASDALGVKVLKGEEEYRRFLAANRWIERYYPVRLEPPDAPAPPGRPHPLRAFLNFVCFALLAGAHWVRARIERRPFLYSLRVRPDRTHALRRSIPGGGGFQSTVARRFAEIHGTHFGPDDALGEFLFPDTSRNGVVVGGRFARSTIRSPLGYDD